MASKKFITSVVLFILMLLFAASKAEFRGVAETSKLGRTSKSALIVGFHILLICCLMFPKTNKSSIILCQKYVVK